MNWTVRYRDDEVFAELERIPEPHRGRIAAKIERLAQDPFPPGCKKLHMQIPRYRIRAETSGSSTL
jgi:mRNA-degrading endonuclease RelE of RelBE toxin-antitoxin system